MNRSALVSRLGEPFDVLVIGGGATGLGAALDAAARGYATALVEAADFASATSSRSTKLVHGGVRYLQNGDVGLVREALRERSRLLRNAPHLVRDVRFALPTYRAFDVPYYFAGLKAYDLLASGLGFGPSGYIDASETLRRMPALRADGLRGAIAYHDGGFDDSRLALAIARSAIDRGAVVCNYVRAERLLYEHDRVAGAVVRDGETGGEIEVRARAVLNATGIFVDELRARDAPGVPPLLEHSRGTHVVFSRDFFPGTDALIVPRTEDGRVLFAIPWHDHVVVGTTDVRTRDLAIDPAPPRDEIDYIVRHFNRYLDRPVRREDALASFAGIRPLVNRRNVGTAKLSREHIVETSAHGLVTITGGKWTTYRKMGEDAVDALVRVGSLSAAPCRTVDLALRGAAADAASQRAFARYASYGGDAPFVCAIEREDATLAEPLDARFALTGAQVVYAAREEYARTVDDVLSRRTRATFLNGAAAAAMGPAVARLLARELGRDEAWIAAQLAAYAAILEPTLAALGIGRDAERTLA